MEEQPSYSIIVFKGHKLPGQYVHLIFSRWLRSLRHGNNLFKKMKADAYYKAYHQYIENLLSKPDSEVRFAVLSDDHDNVLGFSVSREDVLDYIHVHTSYRKIGIAKRLMPEGITTFSHITETVAHIWPANPNYRHLEFDPFA